MTLDEVVDRYFDCVNNEKWAEFEALWADDAVCKAVGARPRRGRAEILGYFTTLFSPWARHDDRPGRRMHGEDCLCVEVRFVGRTHDGRDVSFDAADVFHFRDGKIVELSTWYDLVSLRKETGVADGAASRKAS